MRGSASRCARRTDPPFGESPQDGSPIPSAHPIRVYWCSFVVSYRTAGLPKSHRFTFGERVDRLTLDCLELIIEAIYATPERKAAPLRRVNLNLEKLRVLWRLICDRHWISQQQLLFVAQRLDEIGHMVGGWLKQAERATPTAG